MVAYKITTVITHRVLKYAYVILSLGMYEVREFTLILRFQL